MMGGKFFIEEKVEKKERYYKFTASIPNGIQGLKFKQDKKSLGIRKLFTNFIKEDYDLLKELTEDNTDTTRFCVNISKEMCNILKELKKKRVFTSQNEALKFIIISQLIKELRNKI